MRKKNQYDSKTKCFLGKKLKNRVSTADNRSVEDHHEQEGRWFPGHNDSSERETILIASAHLGDVVESTV